METTAETILAYITPKFYFQNVRSFKSNEAKLTFLQRNYIDIIHAKAL